MTEDLRRLKFVRHADVYKAGVLAGHLSRTGRGSVLFSYTSGYLDGGGRAVATTLPLAPEPSRHPAARCHPSSPVSCPKATASRCSRTP